MLGNQCTDQNWNCIFCTPLWQSGGIFQNILLYTLILLGSVLIVAPLTTPSPSKIWKSHQTSPGYSTLLVYCCQDSCTVWRPSPHLERVRKCLSLVVVMVRIVAPIPKNHQKICQMSCVLATCHQPLVFSSERHFDGKYSIVFCCERHLDSK